MILSAYTISTNPIGFAVCEWPATSKKQAETAAQNLSNQAEGNPTYPNPFWVLDGAGKSICRYFKGKRYLPGENI